MEQKNTYFINPDDEQELARLQYQDQLFNDFFDLLPAEFKPRPGARVLDIACGPGAWPLQIALEYPEVSVMGVDISPQMIEYARGLSETRELPVQFRIMNVLHYPWDFPDEYFDLVNSRFTIGFTPVKALDGFLKECHRVLKHGGIMRNTESAHMCVPDGKADAEWLSRICKGMYEAGLSYSPYEYASSPALGRRLRNMGFTLTLKPYVADLSYGTSMHLPMLRNFQLSEQLLAPFLERTDIATSAEIDVLLKNQEHEWMSPDFSAYWHFCSVIARKP